MIPDENEGGSVLRLETAVISFSVAIAGDVTVDRVLVSTVPSGSLWSASHPFMASEQSRDLCFMPMVCIRSLRIYIYSETQQVKEEKEPGERHERQAW